MILGNLSSRIKQRENLDLGQVPSSKFSSILSIKIIYIYIYIYILLIQKMILQVGTLLFYCIQIIVDK